MEIAADTFYPITLIHPRKCQEAVKTKISGFARPQSMVYFGKRVNKGLPQASFSQAMRRGQIAAGGIP